MTTPSSPLSNPGMPLSGYLKPESPHHNQRGFEAWIPSPAEVTAKLFSR